MKLEINLCSFKGSSFDILLFGYSEINYGTSGIVDKVIVTSTKEGLRKCKVRIRKEKIPGIGDKFSSRCGQKGMCGMVLPASIYFEVWRHLHHILE